MLFSEPKIPQSVASPKRSTPPLCFSALQRAENSSIAICSSAPNAPRCFSALQRAENSSICEELVRVLSRSGFSALQRAENSSMRGGLFAPLPDSLEFQCSSASRKFLNRTRRSGASINSPVSVLFSEPKIPQSALVDRAQTLNVVFQCSSASRKFLNLGLFPVAMSRCLGFSALQRAENSSIPHRCALRCSVMSFQCSSASRKFLNCVVTLLNKQKPPFQCSSASRKFLNSV